MTNTNQTSEQPELPLICIYKNKGIEIINGETIKFFNRTSANSLILGKDDAEMYSSEMNILNLEQKTDKFKNTKWNRFLAKTIYNPSFDVTLNWKQIGTYKLTELKTKIKDCIDKDDDILTQFVDADFFKYKIDESSDFTHLIDNLNKYRFDIIDEESIWKENDEWNNKK
ncbi:hypothetical protein HNV08_03005 [Winogradskyella eckloniae]|uniref:hypothetical protein n=1 Tax=Winogradskyella eckloniae TaxID=1089306 RepID=UPI001565AD7A|nr:hypothetical protein [Winogradskyella eckloniae]NRD19003.1 hypothetical protein [Winogradskyella eckloniae]